MIGCGKSLSNRLGEMLCVRFVETLGEELSMMLHDWLVRGLEIFCAKGWVICWIQTYSSFNLQFKNARCFPFCKLWLLIFFPFAN